MRINAGSLTVHGELQKPSKTNAGGVITTTWTSVCDLWMRIMSQSDREYFRASQVHAEMTHMCETRWNNEIKRDRRIVVENSDGDSRTLNIIGVENIGMHNHVMHVICKEDVTAA